MPRQILRAALIGAALLMPGAAVVLVTAAQPSCRLQVIPDYVSVISYRAVLRVSPGCPPGTTLRVRKASTLNTRTGGAPYQPIKPTRGAWNVQAFGDALVTDVPPAELWTVKIPKPWRWEYHHEGAWLPAEVLYARP